MISEFAKVPGLVLCQVLFVDFDFNMTIVVHVNIVHHSTGLLLQTILALTILVVVWASWYLKSRVTRISIQKFVTANIKLTPTRVSIGLLWRESTGDQWIVLTKGQ